MRAAMDETMRRREIQQRYNEENHITPRSIVKPIHETISTEIAAEDVAEYAPEMPEKEEFTLADVQALLISMDVEMRKAAEELDFERAAALRDRIRAMRQEYGIQA